MDLQVMDQLLEVLEQEIKVYIDILELSKNKSEVIIKGRVNELETMVNLEQSLVMQMGSLETLREGLIEKLSGNTGMEASNITISELKEHLPETYEEKTSDCQNRMNMVLKELKFTNDLNSKLIKNSLEFVNFAINLYTSSGIEGNNYANTGSFKESGKKNLFDVKL